MVIICLEIPLSANDTNCDRNMQIVGFKLLNFHAMQFNQHFKWRLLSYDRLGSLICRHVPASAAHLRKYSTDVFEIYKNFLRIYWATNSTNLPLFLCKFYYEWNLRFWLKYDMLQFLYNDSCEDFCACHTKVTVIIVTFWDFLKNGSSAFESNSLVLKWIYVLCGRIS